MTTKTIGQIYNNKETRGDIAVKKTFNIPTEQIFIEGVKTKKVTRSNTTKYRPAMGKSVVNILAEVEADEIEGGNVMVTFSPEDWVKVQEAINSVKEV